MSKSAARAGGDAATCRGERHVIGLVGAIAAGKSTVAAMLAELGAAVIDADVVYRELLAPGGPLVERIVARFGPEVLDRTGSINRTALGAIVFADPQAIADLDALTHPAVVDAVRAKVRTAQEPVVVIEAVKLAQTDLLADVDSLWLVDASPSVRLGRLVKNRALSPRAAQARIDAFPEPLPRDVVPDVRIDNAGALGSTRQQVAAAWQQLMDQDRPHARASRSRGRVE